MTTTKPNIFVLDSTVFIGLDFPFLQEWKNAIFFTTSTVASELKDIRSKMNFDILRQSGNLRLNDPDPELLNEIERRIEKFDPKTSLSFIDIEVLVLTLQLKGTLITNDLLLQNAASHLGVPIRVISGKKIVQTRKWVLKCESCGTMIDKKEIACFHCGGRLKRVPK